MKHNPHTVNISGTVLKLILKLGNQKSPECLKRKIIHSKLGYKNLNGMKRDTRLSLQILRCSVSVQLDFRWTRPQSLVHPLPGVDIVESITGCTWALRGLCQQSDNEKKITIKHSLIKIKHTRMV